MLFKGAKCAENVSTYCHVVICFYILCVISSSRVYAFLYRGWYSLVLASVSILFLFCHLFGDRHDLTYLLDTCMCQGFSAAATFYLCNALFIDVTTDFLLLQWHTCEQPAHAHFI